jgi:hypothetical protein
MVITMSVMPPFTYPNLSLYSHKVITIVCDLQIFPCPTNEDVTRVHHNRMSDPWTSCAIMTFVVVLHCLEVFTPDVTSGVNSLRVESPLPRCGLTSAPSGLELHWTTDSALQKSMKLCYWCSYEANLRGGSLARVRSGLGISVASGPHPQHQSCHTSTYSSSSSLALTVSC